MTQEDKLKAFVVIADDILEHYKTRAKVQYETILMKDGTFRTIINYGKHKTGFSSPARINASGFQKRFEEFYLRVASLQTKGSGLFSL